jgi:hypothetical protein
MMAKQLTGYATQEAATRIYLAGGLFCVIEDPSGAQAALYQS